LKYGGYKLSYIKVFNKTNKIIYKKDLTKIVEFATKKLGVNNPVINIIITDNYEIKELNNKYRNIDKETDVLSFALEEENDIIYTDFRLLGDIYISYDKAKEQSIEYNHSLKRELCYLTIHGVLHLLGYDHIKEEDKKEMRKIEESVLNGYNIKR